MQDLAFARRATLLGAAAAATLGAATTPAAATGVPPQKGANPPRFQRLKVGDVEVTTLLDGAMQGQASNIPNFFPDSTPETIAPLRARAFAIEAGLHQPVGAYLINTGRNLAMIDCGGHSSFIPTTGQTLDALRASGYTPEQVDTVVLTHIHPEHALGLSYDGVTRNFPNAEIVVTQIDHQFWTDPAMESRVPQGQRFIEAARRAIRPYQGRIRTTEMREGLEVIPGVFMDPAPGHTPGHVSYRVTSQNQSIFIWGDIAHQMVIQLARPRWRVGVDVDSAMGVQSRLRTLDLLATEGVLMGGVHVPWPGFGRIIRDGEGYLYVPRPAQFT
ncbi:MBL fold metallo-hydrolase [Roseococcus sp. SDR]|uniref:MBL fold metallo-hydrolase n=1 Tax=Roseococcus sp. SDR TaxID=2835532 RepID=UPI001BCBD811|nr:MBL fold metallo-hydrolase [Roseococcus sp. SDR]MBS7791154.1 MBL fold metallo-hydrolase [Roseococcus sp. SDR]MBV1846468.1 MBL fold metallo-hydrolase [Roseococcus sp. SDR]